MYNAARLINGDPYYVEIRQGVLVPQVELPVQYRGVTLWTESKMERNPELQLMPVDEDGEELPNSEPLLGLMIPIRSVYGPITRTIDVDGSTRSPAPTEKTWIGQVEWADDTIYAESFDQIPDETDNVALPRGAGVYDVTVEWAYVARPNGETMESDPPLETPWEKITVWIR